MGWLIGPLVTVVVTALIGGAALLSVVITRKPIGGALERVNNNTATPQDMQALQGAGQDVVRSAQILRAGGSLIGSRGPVPSVGSSAAGRIVGGAGALGGAGVRAAPTGAESALGGVVNRAIGSLSTQAALPPRTRDNVVTGTPSQPPQSGASRAPVDLGQVNQWGQQSQDLRPGGVPTETSGAFGGATIVVDPNWATTTGPPPTPGTDPPPLVAPASPPPTGAPGYPPPDAAGEEPCPQGQHREQPGGPCH